MESAPSFGAGISAFYAKGACRSHLEMLGFSQIQMSCFGPMGQAFSTRSVTWELTGPLDLRAEVTQNPAKCHV